MKIKTKNWKVWLIKSTFGMEYNHNLPKDSCTFRKKLVLSIILFPFCLLSHLANLLFFRKNPLLSAAIGIGFQIAGLTVFLNGNSIDLLKTSINSQNWFQKFITIYYGYAMLGFLLYAIIILVFLGFLFSVIKLYEKYGKKKEVEIEETKDPGVMKRLIKSWKEKFCLPIEYE